MNKEELNGTNTETGVEAYEAPAVETLGKWETITGSVN